MRHRFNKSVLFTVQAEIFSIPDDKSAGLFLGKLPNPELPLAMDPPKDSLENSSVLGSVVTSSEAMDLCFKEGDGLQRNF